LHFKLDEAADHVEKITKIISEWNHE
jgi:hypothetical protein